MNKRNILGGYRLFFGGLTLVAVITQLIVSSERPTFSLTNFLSFFTIESNIIAAVLFIISGLLTFKGGESTAVSIMRGAATLYMTVTGVVYILLLSGLEESLQMTLPWVNIALHYVMPAAVLQQSHSEGMKSDRPLAYPLTGSVAGDRRSGGVKGP